MEIFSGGAKAMIESILESRAQNLGVTEKEWQAMDFYEDDKANAGEIAAAFNQLPTVLEFRFMSADLLLLRKNEVFSHKSKGPKTITARPLQDLLAILTQ